MKDICEACSLSRGGVYRYFGSTKEVFIAMLESDIDEGRMAVKESLSKKTSPIVIFDYFLKREKDTIFSDYNGLYFAIHEFAFYEPDQRDYFEKRLAAAIDILSTIFRQGQTTGELKTFDVELIANHIIYFLDSLKTSSTIFSITEKMVDEQFDLLRGMVI
jgi:AcrR family transcriptional regulator